MLRRRLLTIMGTLVLLLLAVSVTAVVVLQGLLGDVRHIREQALVTVDKVNQLAGHVGVIQTELYRLQLKEQRHLDGLIEAVDTVRAMVDGLGRQYAVSEDKELIPTYDALKAQLSFFYQHVGSLATSQDADLVREYNQAALQDAVEMNRCILKISHTVRAHSDREQEELISRFRWLVLGLAGAFLLLINGSIVILLRASEMVLSPVDRLVEASRALAQEKFDHRVELQGNDEFSELANAYNLLAEQLQANEQRKLVMIRQVALTLNHELNNAMAIIELQLELLKRNSKESSQDRYLGQIRDSLERMSETVESLKHVRRIVLTDYAQGVKMLDLRKSVEE